MKQRKKFIPILLVFLFLFSCAGSQVKNYYLTLDGFKEAYNLAKTCIIMLYAENKINDAQRDKAIELSEKTSIAYHSAVSAHEGVKKTALASDQEKLEAAIAEMTRWW
ncbi:MAG TPA: hypothetical protein VMX17_08370, partial [Candidatus Glassbacteria bacterium]|nr:hypothetical protein [Candidatus Glassbacteria bacterium]